MKNEIIVTGNIATDSLNVGGDIKIGGDTPTTTDYNLLQNKPKINGVELVDDKSFEELGVETMTNIEIKAVFDRIFGGE
jgi:hypothetical protein